MKKGILQIKDSMILQIRDLKGILQRGRWLVDGWRWENPNFEFQTRFSLLYQPRWISHVAKN